MILQLGGRVEESVRRAIRAVMDQDSAAAKDLLAEDNEIDALEVDVEEECLKILALHQPVAADLRYIVACMKINNDLERIGDLAVNIAFRTERIANQPQVAWPETIKPMAAKTREMFRSSLDSLVRQNLDACRQIVADDDIVDDMLRQVTTEIEDNIKKMPQHTIALVAILQTAKDLERLADHANSIAEDIIYLVTGEIIRHGRDDQD